MIVTRAEKVRKAGRAAAARAWDSISDHISPASAPHVRKLMQAEFARHSQKAIDTYTTQQDGEGFLVLYKTTRRDEKDVFRIIASTCPDHRLKRSDRELPTESIVKITLVPVQRYLTAHRRLMKELEKFGAQPTHSNWYEISGGAKKVKSLCEKVALAHNKQYAAAPKIAVGA